MLCNYMTYSFGEIAQRQTKIDPEYVVTKTGIDFRKYPSKKIPKPPRSWPAWAVTTQISRLINCNKEAVDCLDTLMLNPVSCSTRSFSFHVMTRPPAARMVRGCRLECAKSETTLYLGQMVQILRRKPAEGKGLEPSTPCGAPDFESGC